LDHRTSSVRNDEIGHLYAAFNSMADRLQDRVQGPKEDTQLSLSDQTSEQMIERLVNDAPDALDPNATVVLTPNHLEDNK